MILAVVLDMGAHNKGISLPVKYYAIMNSKKKVKHTVERNTLPPVTECVCGGNRLQEKQLLKA